MITDATRPRQRFSGAGWSFEVHEDGYAVVRPIELPGLGGPMPVHPSLTAARASWDEEA